MTITLLDLYNTVASQEWSMYDNDATSTSEMEKSLVLDINKAIIEILYSYPFSFREKSRFIYTKIGSNKYPLPEGMIKTNNKNEYQVVFNRKNLTYLDDFNSLIDATGEPEYFTLNGDNLFLYPTPDKRYNVFINFYTLVIGENKNGEELFALKNADDVLLIPTHLEEIFKQTLISRTMLNSIAAEKDENYSAYKKQSENYYKLLIRFSKGLTKKKAIRI